MFQAFSNHTSHTRVATLLVAMFVCVMLPDTGTSQEESSASQQPKSPYPVVVRERDANFSIPNAAAKPSVSTERVTAQPFLPKEIYQRTAPPILAATELISEGFGRSVVEVLKNNERIALGTVVGLNGQVLTKFSLVGEADEDEISFSVDGATWSGKLIGSDDANDVALFQLENGEQRPGDFLRPVAFTIDGRMRNGKLVIGIGTSSKSLSVGMTTPAPLLPPRKTDCDTCVDMGLTLDSNMKVTRVYPRTVGERLRILVGDQILMVNQRRISTLAQFEEIENEVQVGDVVTIAYRRNGQAFVITDKLPSITNNSKQDRWGGGPFSQRRSGFDEVLVHDSVIAPVDCGGPLVNLQGQFCGINIARSSRVCSLAIPAKPVLNFVRDHVDSDELIIEQ